MKVPLTVGDFLRRGAAVYGGRTAVPREPGTAGSFGSLSYRELESRARGMALALEQLGVGPGERVAIVSPNAARFLISFFGVSGYGRVLVPVNYRLNPTRSATSSATRVPRSCWSTPSLSRTSRHLGQAQDRAGRQAPTRPCSRPPRPAPRGRVAADEDATASINYTSGTTARPKGVQLTHRTAG